MRVVVLDRGYASYEQEESILGGEGHTLEIFDGARDDLAGKLAFARDAAGVLVRLTRLGADQFDALPALKAVVRYGVGYDTIDLGAATERGIPVCIIPGYGNHSVSDHALTLILACARGLGFASTQIREKFGEPPCAHVPDPKDMTLGIIGLGRIGYTLCEKARGLFRCILACDPYVPDERFTQGGATRCSFDDLMQESDVISIHCNLTEETQHMFSRGAFGEMRPGTIIVNTARGSVVDEEALLEALDSGIVHAAGLDVFETEPPVAEPSALLATHPRVIATGHYAWYSSSAQKELQRRAGLNMAAMLRGELSADCLNADALR